jgi:DNA modification methylase
MNRYTQTDLFVPLLQTIKDAGGAATPKDVYQGVADRIGLDEETRTAKITIGGQPYNRFDRDVRWARQQATAKGMLASSRRNLWELTAQGDKRLQNMRRGTIVTLFETASGFVIWGNAEDAVAAVEPESVDLLFTSPPYPLLRQKSYGNPEAAEWPRWMSGLARDWKSMLAPTGSMIINLGAVYEPGTPTQSPYLERFVLEMIDRHGLHLCDRLYWHNPSKLPAPAEWVTIRRIRLKQSIESLLWFAKSPSPKASNLNVLQPYSDSMKSWMARSHKATTRPSGHQLTEQAFTADNGGSIPPTLITASNTSSNDAYRRYCRDNRLPLHPATVPASLPEFAIKLTTDPLDTVLDPFFGSGTTGAAAERLGRRWIGFERSLAYLRGAKSRFTSAPGFVDHEQAAAA